MFVRSINIGREGDYGYGEFLADKPFRAKIKVAGQHGEIELNLSADMSQRIVAIIAEEVAAAGRATAEAMTADVFNVAALPAPQGEF
jgi:hypothetical protein